MNPVGANFYAADIPAKAAGTWATYYVEAAGTDTETAWCCQWAVNTAI